MVDFIEVIKNLKEIHFYDIILPFLLVYALTYGVLTKTRVFKVSTKDKKEDNEIPKNENNIYSVISLVFALFVVGSIQTVLFIENLILNVVVFLVFLLTLILSFGFIYGETIKELFYKEGDPKKGLNNFFKWLSIAIIVIVIILGMSALNLLEIIKDYFNSYKVGGVITDIFVFLIVFLILYFITKN